MPSPHRKGIVMAGGAGTRLFPLTQGVSKHLLPVYNKPLIYYPLSSLMWAGIRDVLLISGPEDIGAYERLLGSGERLGMQIRYAVQPHPGGIAEAFLIGREFIDHQPVALALGDNLFYGPRWPRLLASAANADTGATVFAHPVHDPSRFGVIQLDDSGRPVHLEEKPTRPRSNWAVTGLYFYDEQVVEMAASLAPSRRGEREISDVNQEYLRREQLSVQRLGAGFTWFDAGTPQSLLCASQFVALVEVHQGIRIACLEEIAFRQGFITLQQFQALADRLPHAYEGYLTQLAAEWSGGRARRPRSRKHRLVAAAGASC